MNINANIENMIRMYKIKLSHNIIGQSGVKNFYWLEGIRYAFSEIGVSVEDVNAMNEEVFNKLLEEGYKELVTSYKNEDYESNWSRLK